PAGLQLIVVMGFSTAVVVLLWPRLLGPAFCLLIGVLAGAAILYGLYQSHGVWEAFLQSTVGSHTGGGHRAWSGFKDMSYWAIAGAGVLALFAQGRAGPICLRSVVAAGMLIGLVLPWVLFGLSKYHAYYATFGEIPVAVGSFAALSTAPF